MQVYQFFGKIQNTYAKCLKLTGMKVPFSGTVSWVQTPLSAALTSPQKEFWLDKGYPSAASRHLPQGGENSQIFSLISLVCREFFPRGEYKGVSLQTPFTY
jgi:hypothetical protein